ncbi:MAG: methyltransferase domain-containing protein [Granulosicoccus sp.]|nr:methyltransferase domain-containing protein [Granulosicoccus sp.]
MKNAIVDKWNARYKGADDHIPAPDRILLQGEHWLPAVHRQSDTCHPGVGTSPSADGARCNRLRALDLACGRAGNAHWLAGKGFVVSAWDISSVVIAALEERIPRLLHDIQVRDVIAEPPAKHSFDVIVVTRFLERSVCGAIAEALNPQGVLFYQTFTQGLGNSDYLLKSDELPELFCDLQLLHYHESDVDDSGRAQAGLIARKQP